jgi:hypothetical protein
VSELDGWRSVGDAGRRRRRRDGGLIVKHSFRKRNALVWDHAIQ